MKESEYKIICVEWLDSRGVTSEWEILEDLEELRPVVITSIGYLLSENKGYITICQNISPDQVAGRITIPKRCITKRKYLKE